MEEKLASYRAGRREEGRKEGRRASGREASERVDRSYEASRTQPAVRSDFSSSLLVYVLRKSFRI